MLIQNPSPENSLVFHQGDLITITLSGTPPGTPGHAFLRTDLGNARAIRQEIIDEIERDIPPLGKAWQDIPMERRTPDAWAVTLPLPEIGFFAAKAFFLPEGDAVPLWPQGGNTAIKVEPAATVCQNNIYNAFVRQFGSNRSGGFFRRDEEDAVRRLDAKGYSVIPPSGTFRDLDRQVDFIIGDLGFRIIQLLPIQPVPTTYARMGRFGSPFAPLDFLSVDPALAEFDQACTPLEQARRLFRHIHLKGGLVFLDMPVDHTGWASDLQTHHPEFFERTPDGRFASPGAWGVTWADLCKLDFRNRGLWRHLAEVFLHHCRLGVDGFRCDAGYMIPVEAWRYLTAKVRQEYPDTIFFLEGLGGPLETTRRLLQEANLNWAYSELFQTYDPEAVRNYSRHCQRFFRRYGTLLNFAETHDNDRLAGRSRNWAVLRTGLAALAAPAGAFGIANGVEWLATEKIDVHGAASLNWGAPDNLCDHIRALNRLLRNHPAFEARARIEPLPGLAPGGAVALLRTPAEGGRRVLAIVNASDSEETACSWPKDGFQAPDDVFPDLVSGERIPVPVQDGAYRLDLRPGQVLCLAEDPHDSPAPAGPDANRIQACKAAVLDAITACRGYRPVSEEAMRRHLQAYLESPEEFLKEFFQEDGYVPAMTWIPATDSSRTAIVPPGHLVLVRHDRPFVVSLLCGGRCLQKRFSLPDPGRGGHCALLTRLPGPDDPREAVLSLQDETTLHSPPVAAALHVCPGPGRRPPLALRLEPRDIAPEHCGLLTTELGGYSLCRAEWGALHSSYDAILAANLSDSIPVDRTVGLVCCRLWILQHGYSRELNRSCQTDFAVLPGNRLRWSFLVPAGLGRAIPIQIVLHLRRSGNTVDLQIVRQAPGAAPSRRDDPEPATVVLRPFLDFRSNHCHTKAYLGAERHFRDSTHPEDKGFVFRPDDRFPLRVAASLGAFFPEPEWRYQQHHRLDAERGLDAEGDLFSPGYFSWESVPGQVMDLQAAMGTDPARLPSPAFRDDPPLAGTAAEILRQAMDAYVCRRDEFSTVVAGYPWFLDWGRDTLICLRGMIAAGMRRESEGIIRQFAGFEENGTIPNMIRGGDVRNRETSDAPLWLFTAAADFDQAFPDRRILESDCRGRTLLERLVSIADNYRAGTPNGIRMCPESGLVFSPAHYTWMDTNYPAGTPRQGYPIEIQALWFAAVEFLHHATGEEQYRRLADTIRESILRLYPARPGTGLADCLHATPWTPAADAVPDDACRPNQLLAITLGALPKDSPVCPRILQACQHLVFPGGIRSLGNYPVEHPIVVENLGKPLNDPRHPYWGRYLGDEDTRRKPAYHNGTGWGWQMPSYCEALAMVMGPPARAAATAILETVRPVLLQACLGHVSEIFDGDSPHTDRGCPAQAWSVTEFYRVLRLLE